MSTLKIFCYALAIAICLIVYLPTPRNKVLEEYNNSTWIFLDADKISKNKLSQAVFVQLPTNGAEDVQFDNKGFVYTGLSDGRVVRFRENGSGVEVIAKSQGAIFGIDMNSKYDKLVLADQVAGIKILDIKTNEMRYIVQKYKDTKFSSPNSVVFGKNDQIIYFSVSSDEIKMSQFHEMLLYGDASGKIYSYNLINNQTEVLADQLYFVNGLEYNRGEKCLYFVQTSKSRLMKLHLEGEKKGNIELILENILGYPDNVKFSQSGDLWVAIPALRDRLTNIIDGNPLLRKVILNLRIPLPLFLLIANKTYDGGIKIDKKTGEIIQYLFEDNSQIQCISSINQYNGKLYLSSLTMNKIAIVNLSNKQSNKQKESIQIQKNQRKNNNNQEL